MQTVHAYPGEGLDVPLWLLGSSLFSAQVAAALGLPFAFASHFAPDDMQQAVHLYRRNFQPSKQLSQPYAMLVVNVVAAETDEEAKRLFTSQQQAFVNLRRGTPGKLPPPIDDIRSYCSPMEYAMIEHSLAQSFIGAPGTVARGLRAFIELMQPDELMIAGHFYDFAHVCAHSHSCAPSSMLRCRQYSVDSLIGHVCDREAVFTCSSAI